MTKPAVSICTIWSGKVFWTILVTEPVLKAMANFTKRFIPVATGITLPPNFSLPL